MNLVSPRRDRIVALKYSAASRGKELWILSPLDHVARDREVLSPGAVPIAPPRHASPVNIRTRLIPRHSTQNVSKGNYRRSGGGWNGTGILVLGNTASPIWGGQQKRTRQNRQDHSHAPNPDTRLAHPCSSVPAASFAVDCRAR